MKKEINLVITLDDVKLISVNNMYRAGLLYKGGKPVPYIYKNAEAKKMETIIDRQLESIDFTQHLDWLRTTKQFTVTEQFILKSGIKQRDCANFEKLASDSIVRFFRGTLGLTDFDDAQFSDVHLYKSILPGSQREYLCFKITPSTFNTRFDEIQRPQQVLFHHTGEAVFDSKEFRRTIKKELGLKYQLSSTDKKLKEHDTDVFLIDTADGNLFDIHFGILDYIYTHRDLGNFIYYVLYNEADKELVEKISKMGYSNVKAGIIEKGKEAELIKNFIGE